MYSSSWQIASTSVNFSSGDFNSVLKDGDMRSEINRGPDPGPIAGDVKYPTNFTWSWMAPTKASQLLSLVRLNCSHPLQHTSLFTPQTPFLNHDCVCLFSSSST